MQAVPFDNQRIDVSAMVEDAYAAARRGRTDEVELCLARLQRHAPRLVDELGERLHAVARCVRAHPSYSAAAESQDRAAG